MKGTRKFRFNLYPLISLLWIGCSPVTHQQALPDAQKAQPVSLPHEVVLPGNPGQYESMTMGGTQVVRHGETPMLRPWGQEYIMQEKNVPAQGLVLECTAGRNGVPYKPWLLLRHSKTREGLGISIAYPGNWSIRVSPTDGDQTKVEINTIPAGLEVIRRVAGMPIPGAIVSRFKGDWDQGALPITRFIRSRLLRSNLPDWPWVQFNTWYDQYQDITEARLIRLARRAADLGCELFMVDAGWYGTDPNWSRALGDWHINQDRLPNGMEPVAEEVRKLGLKFGMWIEIEHASRHSPIAKDHPEWFLTRERQWVNDRGPLNFGKQEVVDWAKSEIDRLMDRYHLDYIKMDFNGNLDDGGDPRPDGKDPLWAHYRGLMELWATMREKYPELIIENCSSGSLRMGAAIAAMTDTHWVSDEVSDHRNLAMNHAMTYLFPPEICNHWTCFPEHSSAMDLETAFRVSMMGQFGLSGSILEWDTERLRYAKEFIAQYKQLRPLIRKAEVYHLTPAVDATDPRTFQVAQYFVPDSGESLLFVFRANDPRSRFVVVPERVHPSQTYTVSDRGESKTVTGRQLLDGLEVELTEGGSSTLIHLLPD